MASDACTCILTSEHAFTRDRTHFPYQQFEIEGASSATRQRRLTGDLATFNGRRRARIYRGEFDRLRHYLVMEIGVCLDPPRRSKALRAKHEEA